MEQLNPFRPNAEFEPVRKPELENQRIPNSSAPSIWLRNSPGVNCRGGPARRTSHRVSGGLRVAVDFESMVEPARKGPRRGATPESGTAPTRHSSIVATRRSAHVVAAPWAKAHGYLRLRKQQRVVPLQVSLHHFLAGKRNWGPLGAAFEEFVVDQHLADGFDMKVGVLHLPDLAAL